jgi:hypothetical protein
LNEGHETTVDGNPCAKPERMKVIEARLPMALVSASLIRSAIDRFCSTSCSSRDTLCTFCWAGSLLESLRLSPRSSVSCQFRISSPAWPCAFLLCNQFYRESPLASVTLPCVLKTVLGRMSLGPLASNDAPTAGVLHNRLNAT